MLVRSGDLIPVRAEAASIPWTKRKSHVLNHLHRGKVDFQTYVYDTNVGDVARLSSYFNPLRWTADDLNHKFGIPPQDNRPDDPIDDGSGEEGSERTHTSSDFPSVSTDAKVSSLVPKLLIYPEREANANATTAVPKLYVSGSDDEQPHFLADVSPVQRQLPSSALVSKTDSKLLEPQLTAIGRPRRASHDGYDLFFPALSSSSGNTATSSGNSSGSDCGPGSLSPEPRLASPSLAKHARSPDSLTAASSSLSSAIQSISLSPPSPAGRTDETSLSSSIVGGGKSRRSSRSPGTSPVGVTEPCLSNLCHPLDELAMTRVKALWRETAAPVVEADAGVRADGLFDWNPDAAFFARGSFRRSNE